MGESSRNYQNGKIYCIRNYIDDDVYVGSSCQALSKRMAWHRDARKKDKKKHFKLYQKMNDMGVDIFYIELLENYPCNSKEELLKKEGQKIRELKPILNSKIQGRTREEWYKDNEDYLREERKKRYERNKDRILENKKLYYIERKDLIKEQQKEWWENNKDKYSEQRKEKMTCQCGSTFRKCDKTSHEKSKKHQNFLNNNIANVSQPEEEPKTETPASSHI